MVLNKSTLDQGWFEFSHVAVNHRPLGGWYTEDKIHLLKQVDTSKVVGLDIAITNLLATSNNQTINLATCKLLKSFTSSLKDLEMQ